MMNTGLGRSTAVLLVSGALALGACSKSDQDKNPGPAQDPQAQLDKAKNNLDQARQKLAEAKKKAEKTKTDKPQASKNQADHAGQQAAKKPPESAKTGATSERQTQQARTRASRDTPSSDKPVCQDCGTIRSITPVRRSAAHGSGVGAVVGGVAGGALGSQIGHGTGKTIAEIAGVLGGAYAGNTAEKHVRKITVYEVRVGMDTGGSRTLTLDTDRGVSTGTRVHVIGNSVTPMQ